MGLTGAATYNDSLWGPTPHNIILITAMAVGSLFTTDAEPGSRDAKLTLKTSDPDFPELVGPVRASLT